MKNIEIADQTGFGPVTLRKDGLYAEVVHWNSVADIEASPTEPFTKTVKLQTCTGSTRRPRVSSNLLNEGAKAEKS
jgi:hypothetical protein